MKSGELTRPFMDTADIADSVSEIVEYEKAKNKVADEIKSLAYWIRSQVDYSNNEMYKEERFNRTAEEIYDDRVALDSNDYALLFSTFARQLRIPTSMLYTVNYNDFINLGENIDLDKDLATKVFCECYYDERWVLVDPMYGNTIDDYKRGCFEIQNKNGKQKYVTYKRCVDLDKKMTVEKMREYEKENCQILYKKAMNSLKEVEKELK